MAYALWMDTIEYITSENVHGMGYSEESEEIKDFLTLGYKMFKGKFVRLMGGLKNKG